MNSLRRTLRDRVSATLIPAALLALATVLMASSCPPNNPPGPPPAAPVLLGVLDRTCAEIPPGTTGGFRLLPLEEVRLRVAASPDSLSVAANGTGLEEVYSVTREWALRDAGMGYWQVRNIDANPSPPVSTLGVQLPPPMRQGPVTLTVVSRRGGQSSSPLTVNVVTDMTATAAAANRVDLGWRDRGDEMGYLLERSVDGGPYIPLVSLGRNATSYTDNQATPNRQYSYRLTAQFCGPSQAGSSMSQVDVRTPGQTVTVAIVGAGHVSSSPGGIHCPPTCSYDFAPSQVTLHPNSNDNQVTRFKEWTGNCPQGVQSCTLTLDGSTPAAATATFVARTDQSQSTFCPAAPLLPGLKWIDMPQCSPQVGAPTPALCDATGAYYCCGDGTTTDSRCLNLSPGGRGFPPDCTHRAPRGLLRQPGGCYEVYP